MNTIKSAAASSFLYLVVILFPLNASAQLFGSDEENWKRLFHELKKINSHFVKLKDEEVLNLRYQNEDLLRQIEEMKQVLPQLQGAVELSKSETNSKVSKLALKISELQVTLDAIDKKQADSLKKFISTNKTALGKIGKSLEVSENKKIAFFQELITTLKNENKIMRTEIQVLNDKVDSLLTSANLEKPSKNNSKKNSEGKDSKQNLLYDPKYK